MSKPFIMDHPLIQHKITLLRDKNTGSKEFRELTNEIAMLMCYEATRDMPMKQVEVETPICVGKFNVIAGRKIAFIPILRAGLGMVDGLLSLVPAAKVGHIGMYRDPDTHMPVEYYCKLPADIQERDIQLKARGCTNIKFMCIIAAPEGLAAMEKAHPDVQIYVGALDDHLNEHMYIVPGLGDAGDRIFGTK